MSPTIRLACLASLTLVVAAGVRAQPASAAASTAPDAKLGRRAALDMHAPGCTPAYPAKAAQARAQGLTVLQVGIDETGRVVSTKVLQPAGATPAHRLLDQALVAALHRCRAIPARNPSGQPVPDAVSLAYNWALP